MKALTTEEMNRLNDLLASLEQAKKGQARNGLYQRENHGLHARK